MISGSTRKWPLVALQIPECSLRRRALYGRTCSDDVVHSFCFTDAFGIQPVSPCVKAMEGG